MNRNSKEIRDSSLAYLRSLSGKEKDQFISTIEDRLFYSPDGCWYWTAGTNYEGRGRCYVKGYNFPAPRIAHEIFIGPIPDGLMVCHRCDNPGCLNPYHLFLGTAKDNSDDFFNKGRIRHNQQKGQENKTSKLTNSQVLEIRSLKLSMTITQIASKYGVCFGTIAQILNGTTWRHLK